jgi:hypothetical protein
MAKRARKTFQPQRHPFRMGRGRPLARCPRFSLRDYLMKDLSPPPASCDYSAKAGKALSQLYLNYKLGDCVIADIGHVVGVLTAGAGNQFVYSDAQILQLYEAIGGYVPNHPNTDDGCDEHTALNYWQHHGAPSGTHKIAGWVAVNGADPNEYRTALRLFENLYFGLELPDKWVSPMPTRAGFTWDVAGPPNPDNGHCVVGVGYSNKGMKICIGACSARSPTKPSKNTPPPPGRASCTPSSVRMRSTRRRKRRRPASTGVS